MTKNIKFGDKIGKGAYGIVYSAKDDEGKTVAVKRNIVDSDTFGICSIKETDILVRLAGHPFITRLEQVIFHQPPHDKISFPKENIGRVFGADPSSLKDDKVHFMFEKESSNLGSAFKTQRCQPRTLKIVMAQCLLGLEWLHFHGIVHRDIKPHNILYNSSGEWPKIKICDMGLCGILGGAAVSTPGLVTSWYRPPEICLATDSYNEKVDIWSMGLVFFELAAKFALLDGRRDSNSEILVGMFSQLPCLASKSSVDEVIGSDIPEKELKEIFRKFPSNVKSMILNSTYSNEERRLINKEQLREISKLSATYVQSFNESHDGSNINSFFDLLSRMIVFNPDNRISATKALEHPFFDWIREYINDIRNTYQPIAPTLPVLEFTFNEERQIGYSLFLACYNSRTKIPWYDHRIIFHGADVFDRYLTHKQQFGGEAFSLNTSYQNKIYMKVYICMYMFHKFFITLDDFDEWNEFSPSGFDSKEFMEYGENFEIYLFRDVCKCNIYRETLFEVIAYTEGRIRESSVNRCLSVVSKLNSDKWKEFSGGSVRAFYREMINK